MRVLLIVFAVPGALLTLYWTFQGMEASTQPLGALRASLNLGYAGSSLAFTLLCGFGAAVLDALARANKLLTEMSKGTVAPTAQAEPVDTREPLPAPLGWPWEKGGAPLGKAGQSDRQEPKL